MSLSCHLKTVYIGIFDAGGEAAVPLHEGRASA